MSEPTRDQQRSFSKGELDPILHDRDDLQLWRVGAKRIEGFIVRPEGGITRTMGTELVDPGLDPARPPTLKPFEFNEEASQSYMLVFADNQLTIYQRSGQLLAAGGAVLTIETPWTIEEARRMDHEQSNDVIYFADGARRPRRLERRAHDDWRLVEITHKDGPYQPQNVDDSHTLTPAGTSGSIQVDSNKDLFDPLDVGRQIRIFSEGEWGWGEITGYSNVRRVTVQLRSGLPVGAAGTATWQWRLGLWSDRTEWPSAVSFFNDRLVFGSGISAAYSVVGEFDNFAPSTADGAGKITNAVIDTDGFVAAINADKSSRIAWLVQDVDLVVGTGSAVRTIGSSDAQSGITPDNPRQRFENGTGAGSVRPIQPDAGVTFYVHRHGRKMLELAFTADIQRYQPIDMTKYARELTRGGIREMAWQSEPFGIVWVVLETGELRSFTYLREEEVLAWSRQPMGGVDGKCHSLAVIPGASQDDLWMVTTRMVAGVAKCFLECQTPHFDPEHAKDRSGCWFVQAGLEYRGAAMTTLTGLDHFEGEEVQIFSEDRGVLPPQKVEGGAITLSRPAGHAIVGCGYASRLVPLGIPGAAVRDAAAQGRRTRAIKLHLSVQDTLGGTAGAEGTHGQPLTGRDRALKADEVQPWITGLVDVPVDAPFGGRGPVEVIQEQPLPMTIRALVPDYDSVAS